MQHCTDLPRQITFPAHTDQGKTGQRLEWTSTIIRRRMRRWARERHEKRKVRPILKRLYAALLQSFRGQHGEKMVCVGGNAQGNWDPREYQQPFWPNSNGVGDRTTTLRRLLIGAVQICWLYIKYIRQKFRTWLSTDIGVNMCFGDGQKVRIND